MATKAMRVLLAVNRPTIGADQEYELLPMAACVQLAKLR